jgi:P-type E1-E2 ATPase
MAAHAGIDTVIGAATPGQKAAWIAARRAEGHRVLFVGDGVNDGPALAEADVGIAMGGGAASSLLVADAVVIQEGLAPVIAGLRAAESAANALRGSAIRSTTYNVLAVLAALVGWINPLIAALAMPLSSAMVLAGAASVERGVRRGEAT